MLADNCLDAPTASADAAESISYTMHDWGDDILPAPAGEGDSGAIRLVAAAVALITATLMF